MTIKEAFEILLLVSATALCIYLMFFLKQMLRHIASIQDDIHLIAVQIKPLLESLEKLSEFVHIISDEVAVQLQQTKWVVDVIRNKIESLLKFEKKVISKVETPIQNLLSNLNAIRSGVSTFFDALKKK